MHQYIAELDARIAQASSDRGRAVTGSVVSAAVALSQFVLRARTHAGSVARAVANVMSSSMLYASLGALIAFSALAWYHSRRRNRLAGEKAELMARPYVPSA